MIRPKKKFCTQMCRHKRVCICVCVFSKTVDVSIPAAESTMEPEQRGRSDRLGSADESEWKWPQSSQKSKFHGFDLYEFIHNK